MANRFLPVFPEEVHTALQVAHENLVAKADHINRLHQGRADLLQSVQVMRSKIGAERENYAREFQAKAGGEGLSNDTAAMRARVRELEHSINDAKAEASDFADRIAAMTKDFQKLKQERDQLRHLILKSLSEDVPPADQGDRLPFDLQTEIKVSDLLLPYIAFCERSHGTAFPEGFQYVTHFGRFFQSMFETPDAETIAECRGELERIIWGGDVPAEPTIPKPPAGG